MNRGYAALYLITAVFFYLGWKTRKTNPLLSTALYTVAIIITALLIGGHFGLL
ncbi:hypothetical protein MNBD_GAMMA17-2252 [hydrothermal vent metagenome]|uniref:Uncharacterized protein n=1 Tax=hydrothermal vent metagenome TaxID=652676 RepID=A0A3B0ZH72_9ZZZZ